MKITQRRSTQYLMSQAELAQYLTTRVYLESPPDAEVSISETLTGGYCIIVRTDKVTDS